MARKTKMKFEVGIGLSGTYRDDPSTPAGTGVSTLIPGQIRVDPDALVDFAKHVDACGFDYYSVPEHVAPSTRDATTGRASVGMPPMDVTMPLPDPLDVLAFVAAETEHIGLTTGILMLPCHHPVVLAKRLATLDVLSKGRMRLGIGMGYLEDELEACGVEFRSRGRRADEQIDVMRALWAAGEEGASFEGEFFSFHDLCSYPKPIQPNGVPIDVGGVSVPAARRAGARGNGYIPTAPLNYDGKPMRVLDDEGRVRLLDVMRQAAIDAGRDPDAIELSENALPNTTRDRSAPLTEEDVETAWEKGVRRMNVWSLATDRQQVKDDLSAIAERFGLSPA